ncbi:hypothetical protein CRENBAI_022414 [Crenichthys baileyi]|uniref:Uncharacterized protein n=1 Tax=Crenichthys baileyi TaxID=28760 RepID=A0AAV9S5V6_9TELE
MGCIGLWWVSLPIDLSGRSCCQRLVQALCCWGSRFLGLTYEAGDGGVAWSGRFGALHLSLCHFGLGTVAPVIVTYFYARNMADLE